MNPITLQLHPGEVLGLLGVNGAGKSTTLMMMAGVLAPSSGRVEINGTDLTDVPECARDHIGYLPEHAPLWPELTVREQLDAHARLRGHYGTEAARRRDTLLDRLDLTPLAQRLCAQLSLGQRQRVGLACAMLHEPGALILDEPSTGLDPVQTEKLRELLRERAAAGTSIVLSTHLLSEVEALCSRAAILHEGELRHDAPLHAANGGLYHVTIAEGHAEAARTALAGKVHRINIDDACNLRVQPDEHSDAATLARTLVEAGIPLYGLEPAATPLARVFMDIATRREDNAA